MDEQTFIGFVGVLISMITVFFVIAIGKKQNEINEHALRVSDFVELFCMPQTQLLENIEGTQKRIEFVLLIKNAGANPIYLTRYKLDDNEVSLDKVVVPDLDNWFSIPLPPPSQGAKLKLDVNFDDYLGRKYMSRVRGEFRGIGWMISTSKAQRVDSRGG